MDKLASVIFTISLLTGGPLVGYLTGNTFNQEPGRG